MPLVTVKVVTSEPTGENDAMQSIMDDAFRPSWRRGLLAVFVTSAVFLLPQEAPLAYYPQDDGSVDRLQLAITCESDVKGTYRIFYDTGRGFNERESFKWPMAPGLRPYTYIFPLPDAPLYRLRLELPAGSGKLSIKSFRIVNHEGRKLRQFSAHDFTSSEATERVGSGPSEWVLASLAQAAVPHADAILQVPVVPEGMNMRNLRHALFSWVYLGIMLWILLMAVYCISRREWRWRKATVSAVFLAGIALLFSAVGHRDLIKDYWHRAHLQTPHVSLGSLIQFEQIILQPPPLQLCGGVGRGLAAGQDKTPAAKQTRLGEQTAAQPFPALASLPLRRSRVRLDDSNA